MRFHKVLNGRIVASVDCGDGEEAERRLHASRDARGLYHETGLIVSDADWRDLHYKRRLRHIGPPVASFSDRVARIQA